MVLSQTNQAVLREIMSRVSVAIYSTVCIALFLLLIYGGFVVIFRGGAETIIGMLTFPLGVFGLYLMSREIIVHKWRVDRYFTKGNCVGED